MHNIKFEYSKEVHVADYLSRQPLAEDTGDAELSSLYVASVNSSLILHSHVKEHARQDKFYQQITEWIQNGWPKSIPNIYKCTEMEAFFKIIPLLTIEAVRG